MNPSPAATPRRRRFLRRAPGIIVALALLLTLFGPGPARAQECGCTDVGPYKAPARTSPWRQVRHHRPRLQPR